MRSRAPSSSPAPPCSGCATASGSSRTPPRRTPWRARCPTRAACPSCRPSSGSARRTGIRTRAAPSSGSRAAPRGRIWRAPRWRRSPSRAATCWRRWPPTPRRRCRGSAWMAAPSPTTSSASSRPTCSTRRWTGRPSSRRPVSVPPISPGSASASGARSTRWPSAMPSSARSRRRWRWTSGPRGTRRGSERSNAPAPGRRHRRWHGDVEGVRHRRARPGRDGALASLPRARHRTGLSGDGAQGRRTPPASRMPGPFQRPSLRPRDAGFTEATRSGAGWEIRFADVPAAQGWKRRVLRRRQSQSGRGSGGARRGLSGRQAHGGRVRSPVRAVARAGHAYAMGERANATDATGAHQVARAGSRDERSVTMMRRMMLSALALLVAMAAASGVRAQTPAPIESELHLITPVSKFIHDAALKAFAEYAKEKWNVAVKVTAIPAGTPIAYGRVVEWKGKPEVDILWGGESAVFEKLADQKRLQKVEISRESWESIPASIGKPKPIPLKDRDGYWVGTALEPYGLVYHPKKIQRLGMAEPKEWDDLLNPKLKGEVAQCAPTRSSSSNATYEVILSMYGEDKGWEWLRKLAANTGHFTARSRDVPTVVAKGEYTAGFAVPSYMAFEEKLAGFDLKFVAPKNAFVTPEPMAILAGARNPRAARAFIEFLLSERGQRVFMERGLFPITPKYKVQGPPGSTAEMAVEFTGGVRSYFERDVSNVYDEAMAQKRSDALKQKFRTDIEATWKKP